MPSSGRALAEIPQARFTGTFWTVAMCDKDWRRFCAVSPDANYRLTVMFEIYCETGGFHLPPSALRWLTPESNTAAADIGSFEAHGVVVRGRRATNGQGGTFFVTEVQEDAPAPVPIARTRTTNRSEDRRQGVLPFGPKSSDRR